MTDITHFTPEDRVLLQVGGRFTPDSFGPEAYEEIIRAVMDDPDAHLDAFERMFLSPRPSRNELTEMFLPDFLQFLANQRPERVRDLARRLAALIGSLARQQAREAESLAEGSDEQFDEIARQRRQLGRRRAGLGGLV